MQMMGQLQSELVRGQVYILHLFENAARGRPTYVRACALVLPPPCLGGGPHGWVPVDNPQYTRADFGQEAVGGLSSPRAQ